MPEVVPFISRYPEAVAKTWIARLRKVLPGETFALPSSLSAEQKAAAAFAIVAGPEARHLDGFTGLRWVQSTWAGVEALVQVLPKGVHVTKLVDPMLTARMTEAVLAWTFYLQRRMPEYAAQQRRREWHQIPYVRAEETVVGILGLGELGRSAAERLVANGFRVVGWSHSAKDIPEVESHVGWPGFERVLAKADITVCLLPLTDDTRGLLGAVAFDKFKEGASLVNFARGPIVDDAALIAALDAGHLRHAVLDVFDVEPLPADSSLWAHDKITVLPHISAVTEPDSAAAIVARNVKHWRATGQKPAGVDRERGY